ncbi:MobF family relaxase [uncultured Pseudonocardia sp.]|uniref:MobF family relaxase n=1 Tax=uncultured Pseudonocardia sp. TaxID=211455 RepID=UPI0026092A67|nr:MobF family relaxase [uncultured Pseudonocardia sp.]
MLTITAMSAEAVDYLLRGCGCAEHEHAGTAQQQRSGAGYMLAGAEKEPPGVWYGTGLEELLGIAEGSTATEEQVRAVLGRLEHPSAVDEEGNPLGLGRRPFRFRSRDERVAVAIAAEPDADEERQGAIRNQVRAEQRKAVSFYDLTFSPAKSVSVYWAALLAEGRTEEAQAVVAAHEAGIAAAMAYVERESGYVRSGYHGKTASGRSVGRYEKARGMAWIRWNHSTNRDQQPHLHSHVTAVNRATTGSDGVVRALDGKAFGPIKMGADAIYTHTLERTLEGTNPVVFALRKDGKAREIVGFDQQLLAAASSRARQVGGALAQMLGDFEQTYGRVASPAERKSLHHLAWGQTRAAKNYQTSPGEQLNAWSRPLRPQLRQSLDNSAAAAAQVARFGHPDQRGYAGRGVEQILAAAVEAVQDQYATWQTGNLTHAIIHQLRLTPEAVAGDPKVVAPELAAQVLAAPGRHGLALVAPPDVGTVPDAVRTEEGLSPYRPRNGNRWTTTAQLSLETGIVARARQLGAPKVEPAMLELARIETERAGLSPDQQAAVLGILGSGRCGDVLVGPAGSGKSRTVAALAAAWESHVGGRVLGLATSQIATKVLVDDGLNAINTAQFRDRFLPDEHGRVRERIRPGDLIVIDEAGMSGSTELGMITELVAASGGKFVNTGDPEQLRSIEAGGMLALLVRDNGAFELSELHRFRHAWEREASAGLRAGDPGVLEAYAEHGRIRGGTEAEMAAAAVRGYLADVLAGHTSLLVVRDNETAAALSAVIRAELIAAGRVAHEVVGQTRDNNLISVGDQIQARRNERTLRVDGDGMVTNREIYTVVGVDRLTGALRVQDENGLVAHLPRSYVAEHVTLAYAVTTYACQGVTRWSSHGLLDQRADRAGVYLPASRGREANTLYVTCQQEPDHHQPERLDRDAVEVLASSLTRQVEGTLAAELTRRDGVEEGRSLSWVGTQWDLLTAEYGRDRYTDTLTTLLGAERMDQVFAEPGYERLMARVRGAELAGHDPQNLLVAAFGRGGLEDARSVSDVLRHRIGLLEGARSPEREVRGEDWGTWTAAMGGPVGDYARELAAAATARQAELGARVAADPPAWALHYLGPVPDPGVNQGRDQQEWQRRAGIVAAYRDLHAIPETQTSIGAAPARERALHHTLWQQAVTALGHPTDTLDYALATDTELRQMREGWQREQHLAPPFVADELGAARELAEDYHRDVVIWRAGIGQHSGGSTERDQAERDLAAAEQLAAVHTARAEQLAALHTQRQQWHTATTTQRDAAALAGDELERRGLSRDVVAAPAGEQEALFELAEPDSRQAGRERTVDEDQLALPLEGVRPPRRTHQHQHLGTGRPGGERTPASGRDQHEPVVRDRRAALVAEITAPQPYQQAYEQTQAEAAARRHQPELLALTPHPADIAAAQPLTTPDQGGGTTSGGGQDDTGITLGGATRLAALTAELRARAAATHGERGWASPTPADLGIDTPAAGIGHDTETDRAELSRGARAGRTRGAGLGR